MVFNRVEDEAIKKVNFIPSMSNPELISGLEISSVNNSDKKLRTGRINGMCFTELYSPKSSKILPRDSESNCKNIIVMIFKSTKNYGTNMIDSTKNYQLRIIELNHKTIWKKVFASEGNKANKNKCNIPKVLIVEDNQFNVLPIKATLDRNKIDYNLAKNGLMAVDRYDQIMKESYLVS